MKLIDVSREDPPDDNEGFVSEWEDMLGDHHIDVLVDDAKAPTVVIKIMTESGLRWLSEPDRKKVRAKIERMKAKIIKATTGKGEAE